jgi:hypothetical protein
MTPTIETRRDVANAIWLWIDRHIRFEYSMGNLPYVLCSWSDNIGMIEARVIAYEYGKIQIQNVQEPVRAVEIIGKSSRLLIRDHSMLDIGRDHHLANKQIRLYDQMLSVQHNNWADANMFVHELLDHFAIFKNLKVTIHYASYTNTGFIRQKQFTIRNIEGYSLSCVVVVNMRNQANDPELCDVHLHWKIDYVQPCNKHTTGKGPADIPASDSDVSNSAEAS